MSTPPLPTVIVSGLRAPAALHACRALAAAGYRVVGVDSLHLPAGRASRAVGTFRHYASPIADPKGFERDVKALLERFQPVAWLPTCEEVFHLAQLRLPALSAVLRAPDFTRLARAHAKDTFADDALALGQGPEHTELLVNRAQVDACRTEARRLVFKPVYSRFASQVLVRPTMDQLDRLVPSSAMPWVAQRYIAGEEVCCYALAEAGRVLGIASYRGKHRAGQGASICFERTQDDRIDAFVRRYVHRHAWTGQVAFDFRRDEKGQPLAIECNPRATSGIHLWEPNAELGNALLGKEAHLSPTEGTPMVGLAMLAMGLPAAIKQRKLSRWRQDWARGTDVIQASGDWGPTLLQPLSLLELATRALWTRQGLLAASTADIEWNG